MRILQATLPYRGCLLKHPFDWRAFRRPPAPELQSLARLVRSLPMQDVVRTGSDKSYQMSVYPLRPRAALGAGRPAHRHPLLDKICREAGSQAYLKRLERLAGRTLDGLELEVNLWRYGPNSHLSAHRDKAEKVLTHVIYLSPLWSSSDGGGLQCLSGADAAQPVATVLPRLGTSFVFLRSETSWHRVVPVRAGGQSRKRHTLQVVFWRRG